MHHATLSFPLQFAYADLHTWDAVLIQYSSSETQFHSSHNYLFLHLTWASFHLFIYLFGQEIFPDVLRLVGFVSTASIAPTSKVYQNTSHSNTQKMRMQHDESLAARTSFLWVAFSLLFHPTVSQCLDKIIPQQRLLMQIK